MKAAPVILLIDDDGDDRELFAEAITDMNKDAVLVTASNGPEALEILSDKADLPDIIFLDLNMPRMSGKECLSEIKKIHKLAAIPVVMYSTSRTDEDVNETRQLGAAGFLKKPSFFPDIAKGVAEIMREALGER